MALVVCVCVRVGMCMHDHSAKTLKNLFVLSMFVTILSVKRTRKRLTANDECNTQPLCCSGESSPNAADSDVNWRVHFGV